MERRPEGEITNETKFICRLNPEMEQIICKAISNGEYKRVRWGSNSFVKDWVSDKKHDPLSDNSRRIRMLIRMSTGISKKDIQFLTGINDELLSALLRELDKMDLYDNFDIPPAPPINDSSTVV